MSELVRAAGGLVLRWRKQGLEVLLVHRPAYDDWTFPKGKLEPDEADPSAAQREVEEETGLLCLLGRSLGSTEYVDSRGRPKRVRYWTMIAPAGEAAAAHEIDETAWVSRDRAEERLSYAHDRALLHRLDELGGSEDEPVFLIRHTRAGSRSKWEGSDESRPLTSAGRRQAAALADQLAGVSFAALVSSPYLRCVQTLEPLAESLDLTVQEHEALAEGAALEGALRLVRAVAALGPVALSTHGDVQEMIVHSLAAAGVPLSGPFEFAKGSTWVLDACRGEVVGARSMPRPA